MKKETCTIYRAFTGKPFDSEKECKSYEDEQIKNILREQIEFPIQNWYTDVDAYIATIETKADYFGLIEYLESRGKIEGASWYGYEPTSYPWTGIVVRDNSACGGMYEFDDVISCARSALEKLMKWG